MDVSHEMKHRPETGSIEARHPIDDLTNYFYQYARERPDVVALWCFGIGFVLGWKLKPW